MKKLINTINKYYLEKLTILNSSKNTKVNIVSNKMFIGLIQASLGDEETNVFNLLVDKYDKLEEIQDLNSKYYILI